MIWEDEIDEDEERHRPLLDLGIPMDFKAHGVDNFKAQLEELERGVLMLNHLGKSPPQSPSKLRRRKETMIRNKKKREKSENILYNTKLNSKGKYKIFKKIY